MSKDCGVCGIYPKWLRNRATSKNFIAVYGLLGTVQAMAFIYIIVTLTTLEKRFKIPSRTTGEFHSRIIDVWYNLMKRDDCVLFDSLWWYTHFAHLWAYTIRIFNRRVIKRVRPFEEIHSNAKFQLFMFEESRFISTQQNFEYHLSSYNRLQPRIPLPVKSSSRALVGYACIFTHTRIAIPCAFI